MANATMEEFEALLNESLEMDTPEEGSVVKGKVDHVAEPDRAGQDLLNQAAAMQGLTARSYHRVLRVARTVADLDGSEAVRRVHIAEALACRRALANSATASV